MGDSPEHANPHTPPLDRLEDYIYLDPDDPRRIEAIRILGEEAK